MLNKEELDFLAFVSEELENEKDEVMNRIFEDYNNNLFNPLS